MYLSNWTGKKYLEFHLKYAYECYSVVDFLGFRASRGYVGGMVGGCGPSIVVWWGVVGCGVVCGYFRPCPMLLETPTFVVLNKQSKYTTTAEHYLIKGWCYTGKMTILFYYNFFDLEVPGSLLIFKI